MKRTLYHRYKVLGTSLERWFKRYRSYLSPESYRYYQSFCQKGKAEFNGEVVSVIHMNSSLLLADKGRYLCALIKNLLLLGHQVCLPDKLWVICELGKKRYVRELLENGEVSFLKEEQQRVLDPLTTYHWVEEKDVRRNPEGKKLIRLSRSSRKKEGLLWIPYPPHPSQLAFLNKKPREEKVRAQKFRVLFSGNVSPAYDTMRIRAHQVMTRIEVLEALFASNLPRSFYEDLDPQQREPEQALLLPEYDFSTRTSSGIIAGERYLETLRQTSFLVCAPGTNMPFSHNVIEAISQGCIPILEYAHYFDPVLEDGTHCLVFHDAGSLVSAVRRALAMTEEEVAAMRTALWDYYTSHLRFDQFMKRIDDAQATELRVYFN